MKRFLCVVLVALMIGIGMPAAAQDNSKEKQTAQVVQKQCTDLYLIGDAPANPNRMVGEGECVADWELPIPGLMKYRHGWGGNKCLPPRESLIFKISDLSDGKLLAGTETDIRSCGNGFRLGVTLDLRQANRVEGERCSPEELGLFAAEEKPTPPSSAEASATAQVNVPPPEPQQIQLSPPHPVVFPSLELWAEQDGHVVARTRKNSEVTVKWSSSVADICQAISPDNFDTYSATAGNWKTVISGTTKFVVKCTGPGGSVQKDYEVGVGSNFLPWLAGGLAVIAVGFAVAGHGRSGGSSTTRVGPPIP